MDVTRLSAQGLQDRMIPTHQAARYMACATLIASCLIAAVGIISCRLLRRRARRLLHWLACAWMQCDEGVP